MSTGPSLRLQVGLRFGFGDATNFWPLATGFLEEIGRLEAKNPIPLFWNFPVAAVLEKPSRASNNLIAAIRRRIETRHDRILPGGFLGVPHPTLLAEELQQELLWCYRNPWFPALGKLFNLNPDFILPSYPDLLSEALAAAYSRHGFRVIGVPVPLYRLGPAAGGRAALKPLATPIARIRGSDSQIRIRPIAVIHPGDVAPEAVDALLSSCGKADSLHIMFDLDGGKLQGEPVVPPAAEKLFRLLSRRRSIEFHSFGEDGENSPPPALGAADLLKYVEPGRACCEDNTWDQIESLRQKKRRGNLQVQQLLKIMASAVSAQTPKHIGGAGKSAKDGLQISNISMAGSVTLIGADLQAAFFEGRLSNLIDRGKKVLPGEAARSFFTFGARREALQTESAFSFEKEGQTGLRCTLSGGIAQAGKPVRVILDYYIADNPSRLMLDMTVHYPPLSSWIAPESSPLELCLCSFAEGEELYLEAEVPDRGLYREPLAAGRSIIQLYGKRFRIPRGAGSLELEAAPAYSTRTERIEFRVTKQRAAYLLWANLGGSYLARSGEFLSARRQNLSYSLRFIDNR